MRSMGFLFVCALALLAGCSSEPSAVTTADGWIELFNGENLDGWKRLNGNAEYTVEEGEIVGRTKRNTPNTFLATEQDFGDFVLEYEFHVDPYINSGVQIRSLSNSYQSGNVHGYQIEIDPSDRGWTAGIYDQSRRGWLYPGGLNPDGAKAFKQNEWNKVVVEAIGSEIRTWLNGQPIAHLIDDMTPKGFVALQIHSIDRAELVGREIKWRNIRIKTNGLTPRDGEVPYVVNLMPNTISAAEKKLGWVSLFDGNADQWRGAHQEDFPAQGWNIQNGELQVVESGGAEAQNGGDIVTRDEFGAFEFQVEFKLTKGANSGIKYFVTEGYGMKEGSAIGPEFQLLDNANHPDAKNGIAGNRTLASLYDLIKAEIADERFVNKIGEWNHARILARPNKTVEHWLNGVKVVSYTRGSANFRKLVKGSKYKDWKAFGEAAQGHILLQDHGNAVNFRSVKVRRL